MSSEQTLARIDFPAVRDELSQVRQLVRSTLHEKGVRPDLCNLLVLAVDEACSNVIRHGYGGEEDGSICLQVALQSHELVFRVADRARRVDPSILSNSPPAELRPGGLGIPLIRRVMDDVRYEDPPRGRTNLLVMRKHI